MRRFREAGGLAAALLAACSGHGTGTPTQIARAQTLPVAHMLVAKQAATTALFQPERGVLPYPTDLYFAGSTDGTLNVQPDNALPSQVAVNTLDGFSTTAVIRARFSGPVDPSSFTAKSVVVLQVAIDNSTKAVTKLVRPLVSGVDYTVGSGTEVS